MTVNPVLLGVSDSIASDFPNEYKEWSGEKKVLEHYKKSISNLLEFIGMSQETLRETITDFVSIEPASLGKSGYGHSVRIANELGYTGFRSHLIDLGGASVTGAIGQARTILLSDPEAVVLIAAADIPKSAFRQVSDLKRLNETVCHPIHELNYGATLIAMYGLLMKRTMFETGITQKDLETITKKFRSNAISNPRANVFGQEITDKQLSRTVADPYSAPMIAIVTDHGFATLLMSEKKAKSLQSKGKLKKNSDPMFLIGAGHAAHAEYFILKGDFETPAGKAGELAFASAGIEREEIDYAWIYDCFTGMVILQSSEYFGISKKDAAEHLKNGELRLKNGKTIRVNDMGGILNYQAAMSMSAATGLIDLAAHYGLYSHSVPGIQITRPEKSLLGGNGGVDSINSVAIFSSSPSETKPRIPETKSLFLNRIGAEENEIGILFSSTTVNMNPGSFTKAPYSLALVKMDSERYVMVNVFDSDGELIKTDRTLEIDRSKLKILNEKGFLKGILS
ncbi:thiolase family protein [Leptospira gomenensis]|uniref:Thiolase family protein n=1 Tax=Leptospira gomenensis TaxID=2484974 RepID=A0A5F1YQL1_9LEPT|nr:thiolase family protein [Leptospira gomenensis]TGK28170.1 thiolase family protein [Leptospira gomenensis]TGK36976.1 thiolase family protein [Leptospira gomenensis]TGK45612.1 thiolase family protein [Leptospira gomenensis]TGK59551.1 thiolase family protein [Leptospira gomenensis]